MRGGQDATSSSVTVFVTVGQVLDDEQLAWTVVYIVRQPVRHVGQGPATVTVGVGEQEGVGHGMVTVSAIAHSGSGGHLVSKGQLYGAEPVTVAV